MSVSSVVDSVAGLVNFTVKENSGVIGLESFDTVFVIFRSPAST